MGADRIVDFRDETSPNEGEIDLTYLVLAPMGTIKFRIGEGNKHSWRLLAEAIFDRIPGTSPQARLDDVALAPASTVVLGPGVAAADIEVAAWFCAELISRRIVAPSAPVVALHADGWEELMGAAGALSEMRTLSPAFH